MMKAPMGGAVSVVNGQFYDGGEFMPDHGLYCGKKGVKRKAKVEKMAARGRFVDAGGGKLFEVFERDSDPYRSHMSLLMGIVKADDWNSGLAAFAAVVKVKVNYCWGNQL